MVATEIDSVLSSSRFPSATASHTSSSQAPPPSHGLQVLVCWIQLMKPWEPSYQASSYCSYIVCSLCFCIIQSSSQHWWCQLTGHIWEKLPNHMFPLPSSTTEWENSCELPKPTTTHPKGKHFWCLRKQSIWCLAKPIHWSWHILPK